MEPNKTVLNYRQLRKLLRFQTYRKRLRVVDICSFLPKEFRPKYRRLLKSALQSQTIGWDNLGTVLWYQRDIENDRHIVDWTIKLYTALEIGQRVYSDDPFYQFIAVFEEEQRLLQGIADSNLRDYEEAIES